MGGEDYPVQPDWDAMPVLRLMMLMLSQCFWRRSSDRVEESQNKREEPIGQETSKYKKICLKELEVLKSFINI
jgi:hypothetical protein